MWDDLPSHAVKAPYQLGSLPPRRARVSYDFFDAQFDRGHVKKVRKKTTDGFTVKGSKPNALNKRSSAKSSTKRR